MNMVEYKKVAIVKYCLDCKKECSLPMESKMELIKFSDKKPCKYKIKPPRRAKYDLKNDKGV